MRLLMTCIALPAALVAASLVHAGEPAGETTEADAKPTVPIVLVLARGQQVEGTLLRGTKDGALTVKGAFGEQTFARADWVQVTARRRPSELATADQLLQSKHYDAAAKKYQEVYDAFEHLYIFGADALDGKGQALISLRKYREALAAYDQLFRNYSGADLTYARRYRYAVCLGEVGGEQNDERALAELDQVIAATDDVLTVLSLYKRGEINYGNKMFFPALKSFMQVYILYRGYTGDGARTVQGLVESARNNAIACCDELIGKSSSASIKKRAEKIKAAIERTR